MKSITMGLLAGAMLLVPVLEDSASARVVSACSGQARDGHDKACFRSGGVYTLMTVKSHCSADFIVPLTIDGTGTKTLTFTSRATSVGAQCRVVANDHNGTSLSVSAFKPVPVGADFGAQTTGSVITTGDAVLFADCITNADAEFYAFEYPK